MNTERIDQLYKEAEKSVVFLSNSEESKKKIIQRKFAELIVRECIKQIAMSSVCFTADQVRIKNMATNCIKEHFGVER